MTISQAIIKGSLNKKESSCKALYEESIPYVYSLVSRYIWNDDHRMDIIQNIYAKVFKNLIQFDSKKGHFKYWIRKIAINECLMDLRIKGKEASIVDISIKEDMLLSESWDLHELTRKDILFILKSMPGGYRNVFMLSVIDEYPHDEISEILGISRETVRSQLSRAKQWVRKNYFSNKKAVIDGIF